MTRRSFKIRASRFRIIFGMGIFIALVSLIAPQIAYASTYSDKFNVTITIGGLSWDSPSYGTTNTGRTCVDTSFDNSADSATWYFQLIWYDGGANKVLYTSSNYSASGDHCSPTEKMSKSNDKIYDVIGVDGYFGSAVGTLYIYTN